MKKKLVTIPVKTLRIGKNLKVYEKTKTGWKQTTTKLPNAMQAIALFKANGKFSELIDKKDSQFLKGMKLPGNVLRGARINILPDGRTIDGAYSLFAEELTFHDANTHSHWDVIYKNPNGNFAYHYTLNKKRIATGKKYQKVNTFKKLYHKLTTKVTNALRNSKDLMSIPMYTLLNTYMRIGNEIYYKLHKHKGLTTLKKTDITIKKNNVNFTYIGKDGVPQNITKEFPKTYIERLKKLLKKKKKNDFAFTGTTGQPLREEDFKQAFKSYTGKEFYPHIVRSHYATQQTETFLKTHKNPSKEELKNFLKTVAEALGHKRFSKKTGSWEDSYTVTIGHYIDPKLVEKIKKLLK